MERFMKNTVTKNILAALVVSTLALAPVAAFAETVNILLKEGQAIKAKAGAKLKVEIDALPKPGSGGGQATCDPIFNSDGEPTGEVTITCTAGKVRITGDDGYAAK